MKRNSKAVGKSPRRFPEWHSLAAGSSAEIAARGVALIHKARCMWLHFETRLGLRRIRVHAGSLRHKACPEFRDSVCPQEIEARFQGPWAVAGRDDDANAHRQL